jgi:hypothetical protein
MAYKPVDKAKYDEMREHFQRLDTKELLETHAAFYGWDSSYPREDILHALKLREQALDRLAWSKKAAT